MIAGSIESLSLVLRLATKEALARRQKVIKLFVIRVIQNLLLEKFPQTFVAKRAVQCAEYSNLFSGQAKIVHNVSVADRQEGILSGYGIYRGVFCEWGNNETSQMQHPLLRLYGLLDCNSFFASCEKLFRPNLKNRAVVVLSNNDGVVVAGSQKTGYSDGRDLLQDQTYCRAGQGRRILLELPALRRYEQE